MGAKLMAIVAEGDRFFALSGGDNTFEYQLLDGLRRRDVFVTKGDRLSNPRAKLLQGQAWEAARVSVCRTLNLNPKPEPELSTLKQQLNQAYMSINEEKRRSQLAIWTN